MRALALSVVLAACVATDEPIVDEPDGSGPIVDGVVAATPGALSLMEPPVTTIFDIQRPGSAIAPGQHVLLDGAAIRVTASARGHVWIQEASPSGSCEAGDLALVAHRAIRVDAAATLARGQHVTVEGVVVEVDGRRTIADATITPGAADAPYPAYCDRSSETLEGPALEAVLVRTAGETAIWRDDVGGWALQTCFGGPLTISQALWPTRPTEWQWVIGVVDRTDASFALVPRDADDVAPAGDVACH